MQRNLAFVNDNSPFHQLDLFLPKQPAKSPLLVFIHGGAWITGDKSEYVDVGKNFAAHGIAVANINYGLSSKENGIRHPDHANDCATAIRWLSEHYESFDTSILMGHSAGAFLTATLAFDKSYSKESSFFDGFIGFQGIYDLPLLSKTWPTYDDWFLNLAFGNKDKWKQYSPQHFVASSKKPWLIVQSLDDELVDLPQSENFFERLSRENIPAELFKPHGKHFEVVHSLGDPNSPTFSKIGTFIQTVTDDVSRKN